MGGARYGVVDVEDCAMGHALAMEKGTIGQCYHLVDQNLALPEMLKRAAVASGFALREVMAAELRHLGKKLPPLLEGVRAPS